MEKIILMMKTQGKLAVLFCALLMVVCKENNKVSEQQEPVKQTSSIVAEDSITDEPSTMQMTIYEDKKHRIHLEKKNYEVYCYIDGQRVIFNDDWLDDNGAVEIYYHRPNNCQYLYIVGRTYIKGGGCWQEGLHVYRIDILTLTLKHIGNYAAVRFEDNGFKVANVERQLNPNAKSRGEERYAIRDYFFDYNGKLIKRGRNEYEYLYKEYGDTLVNAVGFGCPD